MKVGLVAANAHGTEMCGVERAILWKVERGCRVDSRPEYGKEVIGISAMGKEKW